MAGLGDVLGKINNPEQIQAAIDGELDRRGLGAYVEYVRYVPQGAEPPADASHILSLTSRRTGEAIIVAVKAQGIFGFLADGLLAVL